MGSSQSKPVIKSQTPAKCGICTLEQPLKWKCINCGNSMCNHCKLYVHPNIKHANEHMVNNIKDLGKQNVVELTINKQYITELEVVRDMSYCKNSLWISWFKDEVLQRVKPEGNKLKVLQSANIMIFSMAVTQSNNLLISTSESKLKHISSITGQITDSVYDLSPLRAIAVHITSDNKVLVGCQTYDFPKEGKLNGVVKLLNQNGDHERVYKHDQHKQLIFTNPIRLTSTRNGNIHVVDGLSEVAERLVVLGQGGDIVNIYTGHLEINNEDKGLILNSIVTTPRDNVIVADGTTHTLHILNNAGLLLTYYKTTDINMNFPTSLTFSPTGQLYIGSQEYDDLEENTTHECKIYEMNISGC